MQDNSAAYSIAEAFDPEASVFVRANAGTGKTSLLTRRVLSLLLHGVAPSRILCLTYTNAAAAEMMARVQRELGAWVMADDAALGKALSEISTLPVDKALKSRARSLFARVLEAPDGVRIQTIHGFCQSLLRRFPVEAGISPHFTVMDGRSEQALLAEARQRLFSRAQTEDKILREALAYVAGQISENSFHELVEEVIKNKRRLLTLFSAKDAVQQTTGIVWQMLGVAPNDTEATLLARHCLYDTKVLEQLRRIPALLLQSDAKSDQDTGQGLASWLEKPGAADRVEGYLSVFLTNTGTPRKKLHTQKAKLEPELANILLAEQERAVHLHNARNALRIGQRTANVLHITEALLALYKQLKDARALMDFDDLILTAVNLLQKEGIAPWVLFKLDGGIDHILVDEAQDTSPQQWSIVEALTQDFFAGEGQKALGRSVFIVGDEKQSIFSFQGAAPAELSRVQREFRQRIEEAAKMSYPLSLIRSFRSTREVLAAVDAVFARPEARGGLTLDDAVVIHDLHRMQAPGLVELWPLFTPPEDAQIHAPPTSQLVRHIADTISDWLKNGLMLESRGRPVEAGDIMILVRSRTTLVDRLVSALKRKNVPVAGQDRMILSENLAVQDLVALGRILLLPEDDLTLASLLKSPIFTVSEDDLFALAWNRGKESLWERLRQSQTPACKAAYGLLAELRARTDFTPPYELYAWLLDTKGARKRFTGRMGEEYHDPIDEFLNQTLLYERAHTSSLQGFIHWLDSSDSEIKRDMEQSGGSVRIMTVHGAKGLQAPIVLMPDTVEAPKPRDKLLWQEAAGRVVPFWPGRKENDDVIAGALREAQKQGMMEEYRRLLYVAMTRAEDRLYIYGATGRKGIDEQSWYSLIQAGMVPAAAEFDAGHGKGFRIGTPPGMAKTAKKDIGAIAPAPDFSYLARPAPAEPIPPQPLVPSRLAGDEPPAASPVAADHAFQRGLFIHKLLQYLPALPHGERREAASRIATTHAAGMAQDMQQQAIAEALAVLENADSAFLFAEGSLAEVPITGSVKIAGTVVTVTGQIDRLFIGEKEVWVVDFKSSRMPPAHDSDIPFAYRRQMRLYQLLLRQIYPDKTVRCALLWTASAKLVPLPDALLDEVPANTYI